MLDTPLSALLSTLSGLDFSECNNSDSIPTLRTAVIKEIIKEMLSQIHFSVSVEDEKVKQLLEFSLLFLECLAAEQMPAKSLAKVQNSLCLAIVGLAKHKDKDIVDSIISNWLQQQLVEEEKLPNETTVIKAKSRKAKSFEVKEPIE